LVGGSAGAASNNPLITIQPNIGASTKPGYATFSPDKKVLATSDGTRIKIWDVASGRLLRTLEYFAYNRGIAFHTDPRYLIGAYRDGSVKIWDVETGRETTAITVMPPSDEAGVSALAVDPKRQLLLAGTESGVILGWDLVTQKKIFSIQAGNKDESCRIDGLGVSPNCGAKWFDLTTRKIIRSFKPPSDRMSIERYLGGALFLARNEESGCKAEAWLVDTSREPAEFTQVLSPVACPEKEGSENEPAIVADLPSRTLFVGRAGSSADRWGLAARKLEKRQSWPNGAAGGLLAASQDLERAAVTSGDTTEIRKLDTGVRLSVISTQGFEASTAFMAAIGRLH
jgi:hypothetical protein